MVASVALAAGLGLWQLDAWQQHRSDAARDLASQPAVPLSKVMSGDSPFPGRSVDQQVSFAGTWLGQDTVYVSDRRLHGRTGYWVVTPVLVDGTESAMPVVRGWSGRPSAPTPTGAVRVTGWLQATDGGDEMDTDPQDDIIPSLRVASLVEHVEEDLYSGYVLAKAVSSSGDEAAGVQPVAPPRSPGVSATTGLRNLLYGIQWGFFGGFAVFIWVRWCRDSLEAEAAGPEPDGAPA